MQYFEQYSLDLIDRDDQGCAIRLTLLHQTTNSGEALRQERRKVYIIHTQTEFIYVGEAHCGLKSRFQRSLTSFNYKQRNGVARAGYSGYKWFGQKNKNRNLNVSVAIFEESFDNERTLIEAIEGELVFLIRQNFGYWPKFQREIHFSNEPDAYERAREILHKVTESPFFKVESIEHEIQL